MVSSPVEGDTNEGSNPGSTKKNPLSGAGASPAVQFFIYLQKSPLWQPKKIVSPVVVLGPPTRGSCGGRQPNGLWSSEVMVQPYRVKPEFQGFLCHLG